MTRPLRAVKPAVSYSIPQAAVAVGCSETFLRGFLGVDLEQHYLSPDKPVILFDDLVEWVRSCPTERES